jgi:hypothetical protein
LSLFFRELRRADATKKNDAHKALTARGRHAGCAGVSRCAVVGGITKVNAA